LQERYIFYDDYFSLSLALSSPRYVPYLLVSLGGILGDNLEYIGGFVEGENLGKKCNCNCYD
jgi:hypothetical protein